MDFGKAFSFVFEDDEWLKKIGIAGLISLIPVLGLLVVIGWGVEITRRVIQNHPEPLPDWDAFVDYLVKGLQVFVIGFVYMLPVIVIELCVGIIPLLGGQTGGNEDTLVAVFGIFAACLVCLTTLYSLVIGLIFPAAIGNFAAKNELKAAFSLGEVFGMVRDNIGTYALVLLGSLAAGFVGSLGTIACVIGVIFTYAYAYAINGHLWGQAYNVAFPSAGSGDVGGTVEPDLSADF
ncbi:MAG: DUF4013 domain-containing protein [Chloroflexota bacterium]|nr:DUF4013 domain-containing protein [Chloroflexota bacterium]